jgi:hypothetical protein
MRADRISSREMARDMKKELILRRNHQAAAEPQARLASTRNQS